MPNNNFYAGLDLGTCSLKLILAQKKEEERLKVVWHADIPTRGIRRFGVISDIDKLAESLSDLVNSAENKSGQSIEKARVALSGNYFRFDTIEEKVEVRDPGKKVGQNDIDALKNRLRGKNPLDFELVHLIIDEYSLDQARWIDNPRGLFGEELGASALHVSAPVNNLKSVRQCLRRIPVEPSGVAFAPLVAAGAVLSEDELEDGVIYVDIGHSSTSILSFHPNLKKVEQTQLAGFLFTRFLSERLKISLREAERLKHRYASCLEDRDREQKVAVYNTMGEESGSIDRAEINLTLEAEIEQRLIPRHIAAHIENNRFTPGAGIVLGGGGARIPGLPGKIQDKTGFQVRVGRPVSLTGSSAFMEDPSFHGAAGAICHQLNGGRTPGITTFLDRVPFLNHQAKKNLVRKLGKAADKVREAF